MEAMTKKDDEIYIESIAGKQFIRHSAKYERLLLEALDGGKQAKMRWLALADKEDKAIAAMQKRIDESRQAIIPNQEPVVSKPKVAEEEVLDLPKVLSKEDLQKLTSEQRAARNEIAGKLANSDKEIKQQALNNYNNMTKQLKQSLSSISDPELADTMFKAGLLKVRDDQAEYVIQSFNDKALAKQKVADPFVLRGFIPKTGEVISDTEVSTNGNSFKIGESARIGTGRHLGLDATSLGGGLSTGSSGDLRLAAEARGVKVLSEKDGHTWYAGGVLNASQGILGDKNFDFSVTPLLAHKSNVLGYPSAQVLALSANPMTGSLSTSLSNDILLNSESKNQVTIRQSVSADLKTGSVGVGANIFVDMTKHASLGLGVAVSNLDDKPDFSGGAQIQVRGMGL
jgi:hypothetical protein